MGHGEILATMEVTGNVSSWLFVVAFVLALAFQVIHLGACLSRRLAVVGTKGDDFDE